MFTCVFVFAIVPYPFKGIESQYSFLQEQPQKPTISNDYLEFPGKFEAICKTTLAHESWPKG
jgi:hypothetical protein